MKTKILSMLLIAAMLLALLAGCGANAGSQAAAEGSAAASEAAAPAASAAAPELPVEEGSDAEGSAAEAAAEGEATGELVWGEYTAELPLTEDGITFTYWLADQPFMMTYGGSIDYNTLPFYATMEELTGVHMDVTVQSLMNAQEQFNLMFASGDYPDMFESEYTSGAQQGIEDEVILPLNDYMEEYMPNYANWLEQSPDARRIVTTDDGDVYCAANIYINPHGQIQGPMLRGDWLEELGLELPTTYDALHDVLAAFKEAGHEKAFWMTSSLQAVFNSWSAGYDCTENYTVQDGVISYSPISDDFKEYVTMLHDWYEEGLVYQDFVTVDAQADSIDTGLILDGSVGVWAGDTTRMGVLETEGGIKIAAFPYPARNEGDQIHICQNRDIVGQGTTISTACEEPEIAAQYLDYLYTYDGYIISNFGKEGETFDFDENGQAQLYDLVVNNPEFITPVGFILYTKFSGAGINDQYRDTLAYTDRNWEDIELWMSNTDNDYMLPKNSFLNAEEATETTTIMSDIETYVEENLLRFVVGDLALSEWDTYVAAIEEMGIDTVLEVTQGAYDRYISK